jgi:hypothetical protein
MEKTVEKMRKTDKQLRHAAKFAFEFGFSPISNFKRLCWWIGYKLFIHFYPNGEVN